MDNESFHVYYKDNFCQAVNYVNQKLHNQEAAKDVAQDAFAKLYKKVERIDESDQENLKRLLRRTLDRTTYDYLKSAYVKHYSNLEPKEDILCKEDIDGVEALILKKEAGFYRRLALENLRKRNKVNYEILVKRNCLDISPESVAKEYGLTVKGVHNRMHRSRKWLREELSRLYYSDRK